MSMISAQIDELRELAGDGSMEWVTDPIRASVLCDAADTIWQLRDDLQRTNDAVRDAEHDESRAWDRVRKAEADADRLREELADAPSCDACEAMLDCDECLRADVSHKDRRRLSAENAKLRKLIADVHEALCLDKITLFREAIIKSLEHDMRELGIEVDK